MTPPLVIAHRGASGHAPEHTFAAWDLALELGADFIEQDLQMTADGALVVLHDPTVDRTTGSTGHVSEMTLEEISRLDAGSWFSREFAGERIRTLTEVFDRYRNRAAFYVETKHPKEAPGMEEALVHAIDAAGLRSAAEADWRVVVQSFSEASLRRVARLAPGVPRVRLLSPEDLEHVDDLALDSVAGYALGIGPAHGAVDNALVEAAHERGLQVHPWTVNEESDIRRMLVLEVDAVFTDHPGRIRERLGRRSGSGPEAVREAASRWRQSRR